MADFNGTGQINSGTRWVCCPDPYETQADKIDMLYICCPDPYGTRSGTR